MNGLTPLPSRRGRSLLTASQGRVAAAAVRSGTLLSISLCTILSACADIGDFGRPRAGVWNDLVLPAVGTSAARGRGEPASIDPLTDAEGELRDRSWRFLMPAYPRQNFDMVLADLARSRVLPAAQVPFDVSAYYAALVGEPFASPASRYRRIGEDAAADLKLIDPFAAVAASVNAADRARLASLGYVRGLSAAETVEAKMRVAENACLIAWVRGALKERTQSYRYALEHAFVAMPQPEAADAERKVIALDRHRHALDALALACAGRPVEKRFYPAPTAPPKPLVRKG